MIPGGTRHAALDGWGTQAAVAAVDYTGLPSLSASQPRTTR